MERTLHPSLRLGAALGLAALGLAGLPTAQAQVTPTVHTGVFTMDDNVALFNFNVTSMQTFSLFTTSYGGGTNVDGTTTAPGGFDPILSLFDGTGTLIDSNDDGPDANTDPVTFSAHDSGLTESLAPGLYTVAVTQYDNFANGPTLSDGFTRQGQGNFTVAFNQPPNSFISFIDSSGFQRTANFTLDIGNRPMSSPVPEASNTVSFGLLLTLGGLAVVVARRRKKV